MKMIMREKLNFLEFVGNASTTAWLGNRKLGSCISVAAYEHHEGHIVLFLEDNGTKVKGVESITIDKLAFERFKDEKEGVKPLFIRAIQLFGATTYFDRVEGQ